MGELFYLKCKKCGYSYKACYGFDGIKDERDLKEAIEIKRGLEIGEGLSDFQQIYNAMKTMVDDKEEKDDEELINILNERDSKEEAAIVMKAPRISITLQLDECEKCKRFFNHKRISISTRRGEYIEKYVNCPYCDDPYAFPIERSEIRPKYSQDNYNYICETWCPKCGGPLEVKDWIMS